LISHALCHWSASEEAHRHCQICITFIQSSFLYQEQPPIINRIRAKISYNFNDVWGKKTQFHEGLQEQRQGRWPKAKSPVNMSVRTKKSS